MRHRRRDRGQRQRQDKQQSGDQAQHTSDLGEDCGLEKRAEGRCRPSLAPAEKRKGPAAMRDGAMICKAQAIKRRLAPLRSLS
jgi:hypothetical protein